MVIKSCFTVLYYNIVTETSYEPSYNSSIVRPLYGRKFKISPLIFIHNIQTRSLSSNVLINYHDNLYVLLSNHTIILDLFSIDFTGDIIIDHVYIQSITHFHFVAYNNLSVAVLKLPTFVGRCVVISRYSRRVSSSIGLVSLSSSCKFILSARRSVGRK